MFPQKKESEDTAFAFGFIRIVNATRFPALPLSIIILQTASPILVRLSHKISAAIAIQVDDQDRPTTFEEVCPASITLVAEVLKFTISYVSLSRRLFESQNTEYLRSGSWAAPSTQDCGTDTTDSTSCRLAVSARGQCLRALVFTGA